MPNLYSNRNKRLKQNRKDQTNLNAGLVGSKIFHTMQPTGFNSAL